VRPQVFREEDGGAPVIDETVRPSIFPDDEDYHPAALTVGVILPPAVSPVPIITRAANSPGERVPEV
jgi:hypothetical protein